MPQPSANSNRPRGFSLMELLVVISIIVLLIALMLPSLTSARQEARRMYCLANLHQLAVLAQTYSQDDPDGQSIAVPHNGNAIALIDGLYDYGGPSASLDRFDDPAMSIWGPDSPNNAGMRPLNRLLFGGDVSESESGIFKCPGDEGWVSVPDNPRSVTYGAFLDGPFWRATGTSYRANACRAAHGDAPRGDAPLSAYEDLTNIYSMGPYLRGGSKVTNVSQVVLFCESIMWQALWNSSDIGDEPDAINLPGWHGKMTRFNAAMYDGHATTFTLERYQTQFSPTGDLIERGPEWQFDCFPEPLIPDPPGMQLP